MDLFISTLLGLIPQLLAWFGALLTGAEWKATLLIIVATLAGTQILKIVWRVVPWTIGGHAALINVFAIAVGFWVAYELWPDAPTEDIPWYIMGVIAGPTAVGIFKFSYPVLQCWKPDLAARVNVDRRKSEIPIPPAGCGERRQA